LPLKCSKPPEGTPPITIAALLAQSAARLRAAGVVFGHGTTCAEDEAAWLLLWQLGLPPDSELAPGAPGSIAAQPVSAAQHAAVQALVQRRIRERLPAAYLTGQTWLQGVPFDVDARCIVPRSLIAEVIADGSADAWLDSATHRVLDLCCGGGALACLAALAWPEVQVTASDISAAALAVAQKNVTRHGLQARVRLVQSDGFAALQDAGPWDLVLCNPPYVNAASMAQLPPEYRAEPQIALAGGHDGMDFVRRLLRELPAHLAENGVLLLEIGHEKRFFDAAFAGLPLEWLSTSAGREQVLLLTRQGLDWWREN